MMGHRERIWAIAGLVVVGGVFACAGGGGGPSDGMEVWEPTTRTGDRARISTEGASSNLEGAPRRADPSAPTAERAPGTQSGAAGGGSLVCPATYECRQSDGRVRTITLSLRNGQCTMDGAIIHPDGRVTVDGRPVASWIATGSGIVVTSPLGTATCTLRGAGGSGGSGGTGSSNSGDSNRSGGGDDSPTPPPPPPTSTAEPEPGGSPPGGDG